MSGRGDGRPVPVEPGAPGAEPELRPAAAEDVRSEAPRDELRRGRHGRKDRGFGPAGPPRVFLRRGPTRDDQPESDLPGREGFSERGRRRPPGGSLLADPVPEGDLGSVSGLRRAGGKLLIHSGEDGETLV